MGLPGRKHRGTNNVKDQPPKEGKKHGSEDPPLQEDGGTGLLRLRSGQVQTRHYGAEPVE
jgi:hypothetical protein